MRLHYTSEALVITACQPSSLSSSYGSFILPSPSPWAVQDSGHIYISKTRVWIQTWKRSLGATVLFSIPSHLQNTLQTLTFICGWNICLKTQQRALSLNILGNITSLIRSQIFCIWLHHGFMCLEERRRNANPCNNLPPILSTCFIRPHLHAEPDASQ